MSKMDEYFQKELLKEFEKYCKRTQQEQSIEFLLKYLVDRKMVPEMIVKRFAIIKLNDEFINSGQFNTKTETQEAIVKYTGVNIGTVRNIINNYQLAFKEKRLVIMEQVDEKNC